MNSDSFVLQAERPKADPRAKLLNAKIKKEKAKQEYGRIITDAQSAIDQQKNAAITDVKNMIGKLVIEVTEKVIRRELVNQKDHEEYIKKLTSDITAADIIRN